MMVKEEKDPRQEGMGSTAQMVGLVSSERRDTSSILMQRGRRAC